MVYKFTGRLIIILRSFKDLLTSGASFGPLIQAGTTSTDSCFFAVNASGTATFFNIGGDGHGNATERMLRGLHKARS